jgi:hypothetical protein
MNIAQGNLAIVDGKVYWKGALVPVETLFLHYDGDTKIVRFEVRGGDEAVLADIEAAGVKIRRVK